MRAAIVRDYDRGLRVEDVPDPVPVGDEVVVDVWGAGICHTDVHLLHWRNRPLPLVPGHEIAGHAAGHGPVLVHQSWGCRRCELCRRGEEQLCPNVTEAGFERPGGFAEQVLVPHPRYLIPLGDLDPVRAAPLTDAGVTSYRAVRRAAPWLDREGCRVVVMGVGALGQFAVQLLRSMTAAVVVAVDVDPDKLATATALGAHEVSTPEDLAGGADVVLDFVVEDDTLRRAAALVPPGGMIMRVGSGNGSLPFGRGALPPEVTLMSARGGSLDDVRDVVAMAQSGALTWEVERLPLEDAAEGLARVARGDVRGRLVLTPAAGSQR